MKENLYFKENASNIKRCIVARQHFNASCDYCETSWPQ